MSGGVGGGVALVPAAPGDAWPRIRNLVLDSVTSAHSKRAYRQSLDAFGDWCAETHATSFTKATVQAYRTALEAAGLAASSINVRLSAIKKLAAEAADNGILAPEVAAAVARVKGAKRHGVRAGNWLTLKQAERLLELPDPETNKGKRDRALLVLLVGCGLRRQELAGLRIEDLQQRDGRWCIVDLNGKGNRIRTVPMPPWAKVAIDDWLVAARFATGPVLGAINKADRITAQGMTAQSIYEVLEPYGEKLGVAFTPHDARRTFAKLAHQGHARLEQIQLSLGHASIQTTERYLGLAQDLTDAPCDHLGIRARSRESREEAPASVNLSSTGGEGRNTTVLELSLRVENNNKFVRGRKRACQNIEDYHLPQYGMKKLGDGEYELTFTFEDNADLDGQVEDLLHDIYNEADLRYCFVEHDLREKGSDRQW
jgi:site-specific recombinase XerD